MNAPTNRGTLNDVTPRTNTATGTLGQTPLARLLSHAVDGRVTGSLDIVAPNQTATISFLRGDIVKVKTSAPSAYLSAILYELGVVDDATLNDSLMELAQRKKLHGQILVERKAITREQLSEALREQTCRKIVHLFTLPPEASFVFEIGVDRLSTYGGMDAPLVDTLRAIWRGIRECPPEHHVQTVLARVADQRCRLIPGAGLVRLGLSTEERNAAECLSARPLSLMELVTKGGLESKKTRLLLYCLLATKMAEIDTASPSAQMRVMTPGQSMQPSSAPRISVAAARVEPMSERRLPVAPPSESMRVEMRPSERMTPIAQPVAPPQTSSGYPASGRVAIATPAATPAARDSSHLRASMPTGSAGSKPLSLPPALDMPPISRAPSSGPAPVRHSPPPAQWNAKVVNELAARRQAIRDRVESIKSEDPWQRLSLQRDAGPQQIDDAFTALKALWDPMLLPRQLEDAREDCAKVLMCLQDAHAQLRDPIKRASVSAQRRYSGAFAVIDPTTQASEDLVASGAREEYEGAKACFLKNDLERAERLCRRAHRKQPENAGPLALLAWLEALKPDNQGPDATKVRIAMLDRAARLKEHYEEAVYWRAQLHKRIENHTAAMRDFKLVSEWNPKNLDAVRELRVYEMRVRHNSINMKAVRR